MITQSLNLHTKSYGIIALRFCIIVFLSFTCRQRVYSRRLGIKSERR